MEAFIQFGVGTSGPFLTEAVAYRSSDAPRNYSRTGYGSKLPTHHLVQYRGKWRRVYAICWSNVATLYIKVDGAKAIVQLYPTSDNGSSN